ncbi:MAG: Bax inhibitor-1 family protein, partial [Paludibacteraceae bacterium]|nr:Bax inhibitor-1 family protein [Paludibacteraceae bacterium]
LEFIVSIIGVIVFAALTAYDAQKIKAMLQEYGTEVNETSQKIALLGSLSLYLDFINMFLYLLRLFGRRN